MHFLRKPSTFSLWEEEPYFHNVTLACDGNQTIQAHKVMVDAVSLVCRNLLRKHPIHTSRLCEGGDQHPDGGGGRLPLLLPDDLPGPGQFPGPGSENKPGQKISSVKT